MAQQVANADNITEEGGQIPNVSELGSGSPFYYPKRCEDGPIPVIYREPGVWYWPAPIQKKCIARCPRDHECIATKTVTKQVSINNECPFQSLGYIFTSFPYVKI